MLQPSAAATVIAATGAGLATLGVLSAAVVRCAPSGRSNGRELAPDAGTSNSTSAAADIVSPRTMGSRPA
jgi:hypothetical protein